MRPTVVLRPRMDHIEVAALRRLVGKPCRGCGSHDDPCVCIPTGTVRCRCGRVTSVMKAPKPARRRAPAWRPAVAYAVPTLAPRPRERGARVVAASGRDGDGGRDDGGGGDGGDPPGPASANDAAGAWR
jgi:hypothetical protein